MNKDFNPEFASAAAKSISPNAPQMKTENDVKEWVSGNTNFIMTMLMQKLGFTKFNEGMQGSYPIVEKLTKSVSAYSNAFEILFVGDYDEQDISVHGKFPDEANQPNYMAAGSAIISAALQDKVVSWKVDEGNLNDAFFNAANMEEFGNLQMSHAKKLLGKRYRDQILNDIFGTGLTGIIDHSNGKPASVGVGPITNTLQLSSQADGSLTDDDIRYNWKLLIDRINELEFDKESNLAVLGQKDSKGKPVLSSALKSNIIVILDYKFYNAIDRTIITGLFNKAGRNIEDYTFILEDIQSKYPTKLGAVLRNDTYWFDTDLSKSFSFVDTYNKQIWFKVLFYQRRGITPTSSGFLLTLAIVPPTNPASN